MKKEPKTEILRTRVSPEEKERIEYKALSSYRTVSRYLQESALDKPIVITEHFPENGKQIGELIEEIVEYSARKTEPDKPIRSA